MKMMNCAWCGEAMGAATEGSHGVCARCSDRVFEKVGWTLRKFLDGLDVPVVVLDREQDLVSANHQARSSFSRCDVEEARGVRLGEIVECPYSGKEGGCGRSVCCTGCTIRKLVQSTFDSGKSYYDVPARLAEGGMGAEEKLLYISTKRVGRYVALRMEDVQGSFVRQVEGSGVALS